MPTPTAHKTVQARNLAYAGLRRPVGDEGKEAIHLRGCFEGQVAWTLVSQKEAKRGRGIGDSKLDMGDRRGASSFGFRGLNHKERRDRKEDSDSLSSLRSLRFFHSGFRGLNHKERRDRKEDSDSLSSLRSLRLFHSGFRGLNRRDRRDRKEDFGSDSLRSLRSLRLFHSGFRGLNRRDRRDRKEDFGSDSLRSLRSLRLFHSGFRGLNRRDRRDRKEGLDRQFGDRLLPNLRVVNSRAGCARNDTWSRNNSATACRRISTSSEPS
jgi:hypothetical protein